MSELIASVPVEVYRSSLEVPFVLVVVQRHLQLVLHEQTVVDRAVGGGQVLHSPHAHPERNKLALLRTTVQHLERLQSLAVGCSTVRST